MIVACDGAARGNPGPAGFGVHITDGDGTTLVHYRLAVDLKLPMIGMIKRKAEKVIVDTALKGLKDGVKGLRLAFGETLFFDDLDPAVDAAVRDMVFEIGDPGHGHGDLDSFVQRRDPPTVRAAAAAVAHGGSWSARPQGRPRVLPVRRMTTDGR